jgi:hypothetical protein
MATYTVTSGIKTAGLKTVLDAAEAGGKTIVTIALAKGGDWVVVSKQ